MTPEKPCLTANRAFCINGDPALLSRAARRLRLGIDRGAHRADPPGQAVLLGIARLLDAVAFAMQVDGAVHPRVVSAATEIALHVLRSAAGRYVPA